MHYSIRLLCVFFISITMSCCKKEDVKTGDLNIRFKLVYGNQPLEMFKDYIYPETTQKLFFSRISFYISTLALKKTGSNVGIKDIDYLDLTNAFTPPVASNGYEYKLKAIPAGVYDTLSFGIGVPKTSNALEPKDFNSGHVLSNTAEYWAGWKSYIFFRPEGKIQLSGSQTADSPFALHIGSDDAYRNFKIIKSLSVPENGVANIDVEIDMQKFFKGTSWFDINATQQIHLVSQAPLVKQLADNLAVAIK